MTAFRHLGDQLVHQGYVWHVAVAQFESPEAEVFQRDIVRSPGAVAAVPLWYDETGEPHVALVRQYRAPFDAFVVELPAGMRDVPGETTEVTAARELVEEVGLQPGQLEHLIDMYSSPAMTDSVLTIFLATDLVEVPRETHGPEEAHMDVLRMPLRDAIAMVLRGEIHDAKTVIGLLLVERQLREAAPS